MSSPGIACITGKHLIVDAAEHTCDAFSVIASWCLWCGIGTYDGDRINPDGQPINFTPILTVRVPDGFHRIPEDVR